MKGKNNFTSVLYINTEVCLHLTFEKGLVLMKLIFFKETWFFILDKISLVLFKSISVKMILIKKFSFNK